MAVGSFTVYSNAAPELTKGQLNLSSVVRRAAGAIAGSVFTITHTP